MNIRMKLAAVIVSVPLALSMVPAAAFGAVAGEGGLAVGTMAVEPCEEGAHLWHLQPSSSDYVTVKCAVCGQEENNCVAVPFSGKAKASELSAHVSEGLARLQRIDALRDYKKWVVLQLAGDAELYVDADLTADCLVQDAGAAGAFDLRVDGDGYHVLALSDSGIRVQGDLRVDGGVVKASSGNGTAVFAAGSLTLAGGRVTASGCDYGVASTGALSVEGSTVTASAQDGLSYYAAIRGFKGVSVSGGTVRARGGSMGVCASDGVEVVGGEVDSRAGTAVFARNGIDVVAPAVTVYPEDSAAIDAEAAAGAGGATVSGKALGVGSRAAGDVRITTVQAVEGDGAGPVGGDGDGSGSGSGDGSGNGSGSGNGNGGNGSGDGSGRAGGDGSGSGAGAGTGGADGTGDGSDAVEEAPGTGRVSVTHYKLKVGGTPGVAADYEAVAGSLRSWGGLEIGSGFPLGLVASYVKYTGFDLSPTELNVGRVAITEDTGVGVYFDRMMVDVVIPAGVTATYANGEGVSPMSLT